MSGQLIQSADLLESGQVYGSYHVQLCRDLTHPDSLIFGPTSQ